MKGKVIWFTGLPCSGKTTLANMIHKHIPNSILLDGDDIRASPISSDLGFSESDRKKNIERVGYIAKLLSKKGINVTCAFVSPNRKVRESIRKLIGKNFIEVFVKASPNECARRDAKGLWAKAFKGDIKNFTGVDAPYEEPIKPEITVDTEKNSTQVCIKKIMEYLNKVSARAFYIGRWQPFHKGHDYIIRQSLSKGIPVLIGIRNMYPDDSNPFTSQEIKHMIEEHYKNEDVEVIIIPNIRSINIGRNVGYDIIKIEVPSEIEKISATDIRKKIRGK